MITLRQAIEKQAAYCYSPPWISLFRVSPKGEYELVLRTKNVDEAIERFKTESIAGFMGIPGLEIRCDGVTVKFDRV